MVTVYVVTAGSYSDYHICRVFLNHKKAEMYSKTRSDSQIEEWEVDDDKEMGLFKTVTATLEIRAGGYRSVEVDIEEHTVLDTDKNQVEQSLYFDDLNGSQNPRLSLKIKRLVPNGKLDDDLKQKYERVLADLHAQIKSLFNVEGWTEQMVDEWLEDQGKWQDE